MALPGNKLEKALAHYEKGEVVKYLAIFKSFPVGFTKTETRVLQITHEVLSTPSREAFYRSCGVNIDETKQAAAAAVARYINNRKK